MYLKEINSIPKENRQNKLIPKNSLSRLPFGIFPFEDTKYISISPEEARKNLGYIHYGMQVIQNWSGMGFFYEYTNFGGNLTKPNKIL